jgi:hypothetical protein
MPVVTRVLTHSDAETGEAASGRGDGAGFVIRAVPEREIRLQVSNPGYKKQDIDPFSITKSEKKEIEVQLVPLGGAQGKIISARQFEKGTIFWYSASAETEHADLAPDGTFFFEQTHYRGETMTVVSLSHPIWIVQAPAVERSKPLEVRFPDAAPVREAEVWLPNFPPRLATLVGVSIGGLRVPAAAFAQHLALRGIQPVIRGAGPLAIPALAETGPIDILRGPSIQQFMAPRDAVAVRDFAAIATRRLAPGINRVVFDGK